MIDDTIMINELRKELSEKQVMIDELKKLLIDQYPWLNQPVFSNQERGVGEEGANLFWDQDINKKNSQLFNAFSLARPELFKMDPPYDFEYMSSLTREFYKYLNELEAMGKHHLYAG